MPRAAQLHYLSAWFLFERLVQQIGEPGSCESDLLLGNVQRLLLVVFRQREWTLAVANRPRIDGFLGKLEAFLDPRLLVRLRGFAGIRRCEIACRSDRFAGRGLVTPEQIVPEGVQLFRVPARRAARNLHVIAAGIAVRFVPREARRRMQRLMHIADKVQQPGKVVRPDIVGCRLVAKRCAKRRDLRLGVRRDRLLQRRSVGRERLVDEMPVSVPEMIGIADIL